jgi:hypothetical protein
MIKKIIRNKGIFLDDSRGFLLCVRQNRQTCKNTGHHGQSMKNSQNTDKSKNKRKWKWWARCEENKKIKRQRGAKKSRVQTAAAEEGEIPYMTFKRKNAERRYKQKKGGESPRGLLSKNW